MKLFCFYLHCTWSLLSFFVAALVVFAIFASISISLEFLYECEKKTTLINFVRLCGHRTNAKAAGLKWGGHILRVKINRSRSKKGTNNQCLSKFN